MNTAKRAKQKEHPQSELVKVRMQGTEDGIDAFHKIIQFAEDNGMCELQNFSNLFVNKGTDRFYRAYSDIKITDKGVRQFGA